jgi:hypothetical protein
MEMAESLQEAVRKFSQDLANRVENFVQDISELEVRTYTTPHDQIHVVATRENDLNDLATEGKVALRAYSRISFDGDTTICLPLDESGEVDRSVWSMHQSMVNTATDNRATMLRTIGEAASNTLKALRQANE